MRALWLKGDLIVNIIEYKDTLPESEDGYAVVAATGSESVGDKYTPPEKEPTQVDVLADDVETLKKQIAELQAALGIKV